MEGRGILGFNALEVCPELILGLVVVVLAFNCKKFLLVLVLALVLETEDTGPTPMVLRLALSNRACRLDSDSCGYLEFKAKESSWRLVESFVTLLRRGRFFDVFPTAEVLARGLLLLSRAVEEVLGEDPSVTSTACCSGL